MKKIMILLLLCSAMTVEAAQYIYYGIAEYPQSPSFSPTDAVIMTAGQNMLVSDFMGDRLEDTMLRIRLSDGSYIPSYYRYDGQTESTDPELGTWVASVGGGYDFGHFANFMMFDDGVDLSTITVIFELGVNDGYSDSDPGYFTYLGESDPIYLGNIDSRFIWTHPIPPDQQGNEFGIVQFYAPVPEPTIVLLVRFGLCLVLLRRKNVKQV